VNKTVVKPRIAAAMCHKTILKPCLAAATNTYTSDFPDVKFRVAWLIRKRIKQRSISSKSMHTFLSNLANEQTDRQMQANALPPLLLEDKPCNKSKPGYTMTMEDS